MVVALPTSPALARFSLSRCSRRMSLSAPSAFTARRCVRSPTSRSSWSEFRRPGRHRHREHPPAQRAARIAAAADRHRRRAQGDQPLDLRSADRARHAGRIGGAAVRGGYGGHLAAQRATAIQYAASYGFSPDFDGYMEDASDRPGAADARRAHRCSKAAPFTSPMCRPIRNTPWAKLRRSAAFAPFSASRSCERERPIGVIVLQRKSVRPFTDKQIELVDDLRRPGGDRDRERAAVRRGAGAHARTCAVGRRAAGARRSQPSGEFDARPRRPCSTPSSPRRVQLSEHRGRRDLRRSTRASSKFRAARDLWHDARNDRRASRTSTSDVGGTRSARPPQQRKPDPDRRSCDGAVLAGDRAVICAPAIARC